MHLITEFQRMKDDIHILLSFSASRESRHYFPAIIFPPKHIMGGEGRGGGDASSVLSGTHVWEGLLAVWGFSDRYVSI